MSGRRQFGKRETESGAALLIAIFAMLLISVVAIALIVSSGTDAALGGNYRTSTGAYFAGVAGLEEARGRLLWKNPDYINKTNSYPTLLTPNGLPSWGLTQVFYIVNPAGGETVDPTSANPADYPDTEYATEFGWSLAGTNVNTITSVSAVAGLPGPSYKWVRITPATEWSLQMDVNGDGNKDHTAVLYYDPAHVDASNKPRPGLTAAAVPPPTAVQALEITALSVLPNGSRRLLQYVVAPLVISPSAIGNAFPAALTLDGSGVTFQGPGAPNYYVNGQDTCNTANPAVPAIGYTNPGDFGSIKAQANPQSNYPGSPLAPLPPYDPAKPSLSDVSTALRQSWQNPASLDAVVQDITNSADVVISKSTANGSDISSRAPTMSVSNPMTIVVNGDLDLSGWHNFGYGLLLVTGTLRYDPDANWSGLVLVIGQGILSSSKNGANGIQGAVLVARTRDNAGNLLTTTTLGSPFFGSQTSYGSSPGTGIAYCAGPTQSAQGPLTYKVLSFHEIPLVN